MATIALIRHGSTHWNKEGRAQGSADISLDQDGIRQAELLAARLSMEDWAYIYSSPLARAKETALIIGEAIGVDVHLDDRLRERFGGLIEGTTEAERVAKWGAAWIESDLGLEPIEQVQQRGKAFLEEIMLKHPDEKVLVVAHGAFIQFNMVHLLADFPIMNFGNTSMTLLTKLDHQWTCELHNCTQHLGEQQASKINIDLSGQKGNGILKT